MMAIVLCFGIILTLLGLPGNLFILLVAVLYGWQDDFSRLTGMPLLVLAGLWFAGELLEFFAGIGGAKSERASWRGAFAAFAGLITGGILGTFVLPIIGTVIGALLAGSAVGYYMEYRESKDKTKARRVAWGVARGQLIGMAVKFVIAVGMSAIIIYKLWF